MFAVYRRNLSWLRAASTPSEHSPSWELGPRGMAAISVTEIGGLPGSHRAALLFATSILAFLLAFSCPRDVVAKDHVLGATSPKSRCRQGWFLRETVPRLSPGCGRLPADVWDPRLQMHHCSLCLIFAWCSQASS